MSISQSLRTYFVIVRPYTWSKQGINLIYIRDFLGHVDCSTTEIYAKIDTEQKKRKYNRISSGKTSAQARYEDWTKDDDLMEITEIIMKQNGESFFML